MADHPSTIDATTLTPGLKPVLTLTAIVLGVLGSGLILAPQFLAALYGAAVSVSGTSASRTAGAAIFSLGLLAWRSRKQPPATLRSTSLPVLLVWFTLKSIVAYLAVLNGVFNPPVGKTVLFFDVTLAIVYAYYLFN